MLYGNILKELRLNNKLKQKDIAILLNIKENIYCEYEKEYQIIPLKHLITIANYYHVSIDYIFSFTNIKTYNNMTLEVDKYTVGTRLKSIRKELKLTLVKMGNILNVAMSIISEYEHGKYLISTNFLYTLCKKYYLSADYILGRTNTPKYLK